MSKPNFLLQEVIDDLIHPEKSLVNPLMKLLYFGRLTKNRELIEFTSKELNGYKPEDSIPEYRRTVATLTVNAQAYIHRHNNLEIPISMLEEPYNKIFRYIKIREGISTIENLRKEIVEKKEKQGDIIQILPLEMVHIVQPALRRLYKSNVRFDAVGAQLIGDGNVLLKIPDYIRTKLLEFVMQIADEFGYNIEIESFNKKESNNQIINNFMNTTINTSGDGNLVNAGDGNTIHYSGTINKGDLEKLTSVLRDHGIEQTDIAEIAEIIQSESPNPDNKLGERTSNWILKIIEKSLKGVGKIGTGVSSNLLATLIKSYYGIE